MEKATQATINAVGGQHARAPRAGKRADIQGLRAIAVLLVIADHLFRFPQGGFIGVDIFFVISGFLITGILLREHDNTGRISFRTFYSRRIRRIVPAAMVVIITTMLAAHLLLSVNRFQEVAKDGFWASVFLGNWHMAAVGIDYFQLGQPPSPLQHYWSLSVEEQFYFVWPWLLLGVLALFAKLWKGTGHIAVSVVMVLIMVASFIWAVTQSGAEPTVAYFSTLTRTWELAAGGLLALLAPVVARIPNRTRPYLLWIGLAGITASALLIGPTMPFPGPWAGAPVLATIMVIAAGGAIRSPLNIRLVTHIGDISYSLYLWHFPVLILLLAVLPATSPLYLAGSLVLMFGLATLSYHFVENAFRHGVSRLPKLWPKTLLAAIMVGIVGVAALGFTVELPAPTPAPTPQVATSTTSETVSCFGAAYIANASKCGPEDLPPNVYPSKDAVFDDVGDMYLCFRDRDEPMKTCHYGHGDTRVALVGDSHAGQLLTPIRASLSELGWSLDTYLGFGCQWQIPVTPDCPVMSDIIAALNAKKYDIIIVTGARWVGGGGADYARAYAAAWNAATAGTEVIVIADVPAPSAEALDCVSRIDFDVRNNQCGTPASEALAIADPLLDAAKLTRNKNLRVVNTTSFYCHAGVCPSVVGGVQIYRDTGAHVTSTWLMTLRPYLVKKLADVLIR